MKLEKISLEELISPEYNPRSITIPEMNKLKRSLEEFGYIDPLIVNDVNMHIVGGNQRYHALKELGYTEADVVFIHEPNISREKGLNIALNRISGDWDYPKLNNILDELVIDTEFDISLTGFDNLDLNMLGEDLENLDLGEDSLNDNQSYHKSFMVIVDCEDESVAEDLYNGLINEGYKARIKY